MTRYGLIEKQERKFGRMSKEKQIEEITEDLCNIECKGMKCNTCDHYGCEYRMLAEALYNAGYRKQNEGEWEERPDLRGFVCSNGCGELLTELEEDAALPKFCPNCGTKMKNGTTIQEHVEILCKRLCRMKGGGE